MIKVPVRNLRGEVIGYNNVETDEEKQNRITDPGIVNNYDRRASGVEISPTSGQIRSVDSTGQTLSIQMPDIDQYDQMEKGQVQRLWAARHKASVDETLNDEEKLMALTAIDQKLKAVPPSLSAGKKRTESAQDIFNKSIVTHNGKQYQVTKSGEFKPLDTGEDDAGILIEEARMSLEGRGIERADQTQDQIIEEAQKISQMKAQLRGGIGGQEGGQATQTGQPRPYTKDA